jgi:hypothetical protein
MTKIVVEEVVVALEVSTETVVEDKKTIRKRRNVKPRTKKNSARR